MNYSKSKNKYLRAVNVDKFYNNEIFDIKFRLIILIKINKYRKSKYKYVKFSHFVTLLIIKSILVIDLHL